MLKFDVEILLPSKKVSNLLKHIDKLSHTDKERVFQWVKRYSTLLLTG